MSKARKLQLEVDSTLRKVHEGVEVWEDELEKHLSDPSSKENARQFDNLKRDLKKLQKLREQVRGYLATGEIKGQDAALQEARRSIESCMERFKRCEREHKITRFSSAGLKRDDTDPAVQAKIKCGDWLNDVVTQLETQIEQQEADLEALGPAATGRSKGKSSAANAALAEKAKELSFQISRHQEYVSKVERVLRLLENDQVTPEEVENALKDSLDYFIEAAYEEGADFIEDEEIWDALPLEAVEENVGKIAVHKTTSENSGTYKGGEEEEVEGEEAESRSLSAESSSKQLGKTGKGMPQEEEIEVKNDEKMTEPSAEPSAVEPTTVVEGVANYLAASVPSANVTTGGEIDGSFTTEAVVSPGRPYSDGGGGAASAAATTPTSSSEMTGTPSPSSAIPAVSSKQKQPITPPPLGFVAPTVSVVTPVAFGQTVSSVPGISAGASPQQQQQQYFQGGTGPAPASTPGSPFKTAGEQQLEYQQAHSSGECSANSMSDLTGGTSSGTSGFRSPFAAKAATAFTPQQSLDAPSSSSSSYFSSAAAAAAAAGAGAAGAGALPPGYYYQDGAIKQSSLAYAPTIPSPPTSTSPLGADWFSFSASWIGEADAQYGGASSATANSAAGAANGVSWLPTRGDVALIDAGAMQYRPITGDADWRKNDGSYSTPADDFYFTNSDGGGDGRGGHTTTTTTNQPPLSADHTRPEWRPRYPTCTPLSYPTEVHPALKHENTFSKLQLETLFFSFFFHQGSRQQLFAANRLKLQGWRYHKKLSTWFARTMQPEVVTEEYEEGVMAYWDPILRAVQLPGGGGDGGGSGTGAPPVMAVGGWSRGTTAPNFRFEYALLENENTAVPSG